MRKYWKLLTAMIVIISTIGTYYISSYIEARSYPEFHIQMLEGNDQVIQSLVISMLYRDEEREGYAQLTKERNVYRHQQSFFDQQKGVPFSYERRLREQYRKILRSGHYYGSNIFENDHYIAMANIIEESQPKGNKTLVVKLLAKKSGKLRSISHSLDNKIHPRVQDLQMNGNEIIVFTSRWEEDGQGVTETIHTFHFDIDSGTLIGEATLLSGEAESVAITKLEETPQWQPNEYIVYRKKGAGHASIVDNSSNVADVEMVEVQVPAGNMSNTNELIAYEVSTGEIKVIGLPDEFRSKGVSWFDGSNLYFADYAEETRVTVFSIKEEKVLSNFVIEHDPVIEQTPVISVKNGYLYTLDSRATENHPARLNVWDVKTGQRVFRGEIAKETSKNTPNPFEVEMYNLFFRY